MKAEIRKHYFLDQYVIIAPKRVARPNELAEREVPLKSNGSESCIFCPQNQTEPAILEYKERGKWIIRVIDNKFPALTLDNKKAFGKQEVIIETPKHNQELHEMPISHIEKLVDVYAERFLEISQVPGIKYVLVFKNEGGKAGASIAHDHSQVIALPIIPPNIVSESNALDEYRLKNGTCAFCDIIKKELKEKKRVIWCDDQMIAISPYCTSAPYGVWIMPLKHTRTIADMNDAQKKSLAKMLKHILGKLDGINLSYNYFIHNSLELESHHLRIKISPRLNIWGGLELGSGVIINPVSPEDAKEFYCG